MTELRYCFEYGEYQHFKRTLLPTFIQRNETKIVSFNELPNYKDYYILAHGQLLKNDKEEATPINLVVDTSDGRNVFFVPHQDCSWLTRFFKEPLPVQIRENVQAAPLLLLDDPLPNKLVRDDYDFKTFQELYNPDISNLIQPGQRLEVTGLQLFSRWDTVIQFGKGHLGCDLLCLHMLPCMVLEILDPKRKHHEEEFEIDWCPVI